MAKRGGDRGLVRSTIIRDEWPATLLPYLVAKPRQLLIRITALERDQWPRAGRGFEREGHRVRDDEVGMHKRLGQLTRVLGRIGVRSRDHQLRQLVVLPLQNSGRRRPVHDHRRTTHARVGAGMKALDTRTDSRLVSSSFPTDVEQHNRARRIQTVTLAKGLARRLDRTGNVEWQTCADQQGAACMYTKGMRRLPAMFAVPSPQAARSHV